MTTKTFFICFLIGVVNTVELPGYLMDLKCPWNDNIRDCMMKNGDLAIPLVARGDPDYGIPKMKPLEISSLNLISTSSLTLNLTNLKIFGLENLRHIDVRLNTKEGVNTHILRGENITVNGQYSVDGNILVMPLKGEGDFSIYFKNGIYKVTITLTFIEKNYDKYMKILDTRLVPQFEQVKFQFDNLFDGNKQLGDQVNSFLNENWDLIAVDFGPGIAETIAGYIKEILEGFCSRVPVKNIWLQ